MSATDAKRSGAGESLSADFVRSILDYDAETGIFRWKRRVFQPKKRTDASLIWNNRYAGQTAGCIAANGYVMVTINKRHHYAHRLAWLIMTGEWPANQIDHIDCDRASNRWANLREATIAENSRNRGAMRRNTSGFKGVGFHRKTGRWRAYIRHEGKMLHLGLFDTAEQAHLSYCQSAKTLHGKFARTA